MPGAAHVPRDPIDAFCECSQREVLGYTTHAIPCQPIPSPFPRRAGSHSTDLRRKPCPPLAPESPKHQCCHVGGRSEESAATLTSAQLYPAQPQQPTPSIPRHSPSQFLAVTSSAVLAFPSTAGVCMAALLGFPLALPADPPCQPVPVPGAGGSCKLPVPPAASDHRIRASLTLEKTSKIIKSNHQPNPTMPAKPRAELPCLHIF